MIHDLISKVIQVSGMTCNSCEEKIQNKLLGIRGMKEAKASFIDSEIIITYDEKWIKLDRITNTIEELGYNVIKVIDANDNTSINDNKMNIPKIIGIGAIFFAIYLMIKNTVGFNFIPKIDQNMSYGILFVVGLLTSLHCIAMCGGINLSQCVASKLSDDNSRLAKLRPSFLYNLGRIISYTLIGGIIGVIGQGISFSGSSKGAIAIITGVVMMIMGLNMLNIFPWLRKFNLRIPKILADKIHKVSGKGPFYIGLFNGLMPCGPLQTMQLYALGTGSFIGGATSMFIFSLGTVPLMFGFGAISTFLSRKFTQNMLKVSASLVIILGIIMISRGLNLSGYDIALASPVSASGSIANVKGDVQIVTTNLESGRYIPIVVQKGIPVRWTIIAKESDLNGCNNPMTIPKYNKEVKLVPGENIIEFIPEEEENIKYTCWMGMISSTIKVVPDISKATDIDINDLDEPGIIGNGSKGLGCSGSCCGN